MCKIAFLSIFAVSNGRLYHALTAQAAGGSVPHTDKRGRHVPVNKTSKEKLLFVGEHIEKFPRYESHYSRSDNPNCRYLSPSLSITTMCHLYTDLCTEKNEEHVSEWKYREIFNTEYNLSFGRCVPCVVCDITVM